MRLLDGNFLQQPGSKPAGIDVKEYSGYSPRAGLITVQRRLR
jgi:hypothetical protein